MAYQVGYIYIYIYICMYMYVSDLRHPHADPAAAAKRHHVIIQPPIRDRIQPACRVELHRVGEDFFVTLHDPRAHADDCL